MSVERERKLEALRLLYTTLSMNLHPGENTRRCIGELECLLMDLANKIASPAQVVEEAEPVDEEAGEDEYTIADETEEEEEEDPDQD